MMGTYHCAGNLEVISVEFILIISNKLSISTDLDIRHWRPPAEMTGAIAFIRGQ
jgi:hypothetical protein